MSARPPVAPDDLARIVHDPLVRAAVAAWSGRTLVIAGAGGLIARTLAQALAHLARVAPEGGPAVVCLVRDVAAASGWAGASGVRLVRQALGEPIGYDGPADVIVHGGGSSSPRAYADDPLGVLAANARAAFDVVDLARRAGASTVGFLSSREVYGRVDASPIREDAVGVLDHLAPRQAYPEAKRAAEAVLAAGARELGYGVRLLRLSSVYGPGMPSGDGRAMTDVVGARRRGEAIRLTSPGQAVRGYCYVTDAVRGCLLALAAGVHDAYNVADEREPISVRELAGRVANLPVPGLAASPVVVDPDAARAGWYSPVPYAPLDVGRLEALGWRPAVSLTEGLNSTLRAPA